MMVPLPSGVYFQDMSGSVPEVKLRSSPESPIIDPHLSPDGSLVAYVRDDELFVLDLRGGEPRKLTYCAKENGKTHGLAEYIAQEEMDRKVGFWWSPDSKHIAFAEVDSSGIPSYRIMHQGKSSVGSDAQEDHPYPFAGGLNAKVRIGVVSVCGEGITWMDLQCGGSDRADKDNEYLARVNWMPDNALMIQVLNRSHTKLKILKFDIVTGQKETVLEEEQDIWITLHDCFMPLEKGVGKFAGGFIWASDKDGFRHLYLHDKNGACLGPITQGNWMVEQIVGVNENAGIVYFTGTVDGPLESNLYCTSLFQDWNLPLQSPKRLTHGQGNMQLFLIIKCREIIQISAKDGTILYGALYEPDSIKFGPPPYKTLISVYGGPTVQSVCDSWINTVDMRAQYLRNKGILVWKLDNRGTSRRGLKFESFLKHNIGCVDAEDQFTGAEWLIKQGLSKPGHIGLYGWSYGGFLSALSLARFPDTFTCAVSGAPVSAWDGYDTFYTEKYLGLPLENSGASTTPPSCTMFTI
ncbi:hypothetical protein HPP92_002922 [Vanilla planifolia]|uniref:Dipeptidyl-peptidase IV n=1 Tax=Vanilla planifolia TaxID=51239 RepID=A0A835RTW7_VANPL|nr:hypothetical protein HPP92_002922 [Vanilla planifolia]